MTAFTMTSPDELVDAFRARVRGDGERFSLWEAMRAMEAFYQDERVDGYDDDHLTIVAGQYGKGADGLQSSFFRQLGLFCPQLEVSLFYPTNARSWFLGSHLDCCNSVADAARLFSELRSSRWYRRFSSVPPTRCTIRLHSEDEVSDTMAKVIPKMAEVLGPLL